MLTTDSEIILLPSFIDLMLCAECLMGNVVAARVNLETSKATGRREASSKGATDSHVRQ